MLRFHGSAVSHAGLVRPGNEDAGFVGPRCMAVADGVGGAAAGEVASATAAYVVSTVAAHDPHAEPVDLLRRALLLAQQQLAAGVREHPADAGMATTLTAVLTDGKTFALAHLGDCRCYVLRADQLTRVTQDHTYVQRLVDEGDLEESEVAQHPWRNVVERSLGGAPEETGEVTLLRLRVGDRVLLASDGLTDLVDEELWSVIPTPRRRRRCSTPPSPPEGRTTSPVWSPRWWRTQRLTQRSTQRSTQR